MKWKQMDGNLNNERPIPDWTGNILVPDKILEPIEYFRHFFDHNILTLICNESNKYAIQNDVNRPLYLDSKELEQFIGVCIYMCLFKQSRTRRYWVGDLEMNAVTDFFSRNRWEKIKSSLHFADNRTIPQKGTPE